MGARPKCPREFDRRFWARDPRGSAGGGCRPRCRHVCDVGQADVPQGWWGESHSRGRPGVPISVVVGA